MLSDLYRSIKDVELTTSEESIDVLNGAEITGEGQGASAASKFSAVIEQDTAFDTSIPMRVPFCRHVKLRRFGGTWCFHLQGSCARTQPSKRRPTLTQYNNDPTLAT